MAKPRRQRPYEDRFWQKARFDNEELFAHPKFQKALQCIRDEFNIPYPPTPEAMEAWYKQYWGDQDGLIWMEALSDRSSDYWRFSDAIKAYCDALSAKYNIPFKVKWNLIHPFDEAVDEALSRLGLPHT